MKRLVVVLALLLFAAVALAQDNAPLGNTYAEGPAQIHIYVQMKGVAFSLDNTVWNVTSDYGQLGPNETVIMGVDASSAILIQNDGGVVIDLTMDTYDNFAGATWTPITDVTINTFDTYPDDDQYYLEPYYTDSDPATTTPPTDDASFTGHGLGTAVEEVADGNGWANNYSYTGNWTTGINIPAYIPDNPSYGDQALIYFLLIAPSSSTTLDEHELIAEITAKLAD